MVWILNFLTVVFKWLERESIGVMERSLDEEKGELTSRIRSFSKYNRTLGNLRHLWASIPLSGKSADWCLLNICTEYLSFAKCAPKCEATLMKMV